MAPHIGANLCPQSVYRATVEVIEDRTWFVPAHSPGVQDPIPEFGIRREQPAAPTSRRTSNPPILSNTSRRNAMFAPAPISQAGQPFLRVWE